jgi:hypothetical protein
VEVADLAAADVAATKGSVMSNSSKLSITGALAAATCTLLGSGLPEPVQAQEEPGWDFNTALLYYGEDGDRVQDLSLNVLARRTFLDDKILSLGLTVDALTGASPNGALPQSSAQTFTRPSGEKTYTTPAGELPLDDSFLDTRVALTASWQQPLGRLFQLSVGASASAEYDYTHVGLNAKLARDFNKRNTTISAGIAVAHDTLDPVGKAPIGLAPMLGEEDLSNRMGDQTKDVLDVVFGVTQVMSRNLLMQFNYSYSDTSGYLNDPYKILSIVDSEGDAVPTNEFGNDGPSQLNVYENRPDERVKHSLFTQAKYYMGGKVLDVSNRYMTDDWEIDSHTFDLHYRWPIRERRYIEPHFRFYTQSEAEFYRASLADGQALPEYASSDYRLGNFDAFTAGLKYGWKTSGDNDMSVRLEFYQQSGSIPSGQLIGNQLSRDNYPDLNAVILQYSYRFGR